MWNIGRYGGVNMVLGFGIIWLIIQLAVVIGVIYLIIYLIKNSNRSANTRSNALEILKERYARGEISEEEFEEKRKKLME